MTVPSGGARVPRPRRGLSGRRLVADLETRLLGRRREATLDACLHPGHQRAVAKLIPAFLRVMDRDDHPAVGGRARGMEHLALRQAAVAGMPRCDRRRVLLLGAISEPMYDAISHLAAPLHLEATRRAARSRPYTRRS